MQSYLPGGAIVHACVIHGSSGLMMPFLPPNQQRQSTEGKMQKCHKSTHKIAAIENSFNNSCHECSTVEAWLPTYRWNTQHWIARQNKINVTTTETISVVHDYADSLQ